MSERRRRARAPLDVYLNKYVGGVPYMARTRDISAEGVGLAHLIEPRHSKKRVGLQFQLPGSDEVIYCEGEIVREWGGEKSAEQSGIRFTLMTDRHRRLIEGYVAEQHQQGHE
jgi:PilZ domain